MDVLDDASGEIKNALLISLCAYEDPNPASFSCSGWAKQNTATDWEMAGSNAAEN